MQQPAGDGIGSAGLWRCHDPGAVAVFANGIERVAQLQILLCNGTNFGHRLGERHHIGLAVKHHTRAGERHFERGEVIRPVEGEIGTVAHF